MAKGGILAGALAGAGQGIAYVGKQGLELDIKRQLIEMEEAKNLRAEDRAQARKISEENRVTERRQGILSSVDQDVAAKTASWKQEADAGPIQAELPNRSAMIRDKAIASGDMDLARVYSEDENRQYQRSRDAKADQRADRTEARQDKQTDFSQKQSAAQLDISRRQVALAESKNTADQNALKNQGAAAQKFVDAPTEAEKQKALGEYVAAGGKRKDLIDDADFTIKSLTNAMNALSLAGNTGDAEEVAGILKHKIDSEAARSGQKKLVADPDAKSFRSEADVSTALSAGKLKYGDIVTVGGKRFKVQE